MKSTLRLLTTLLLCMILCCCLSAAASAETVADGTCGDALTWTLDDAGTLTISGTGAMADYEQGTAPWYSNRLSINSVMIENSVTSIGGGTFFDCTNLASVTIPDSVTNIGRYAFYDCSSMAAVYYSGAESQWDSITIENGNGDLPNALRFYNGETPDVCTITFDPNGATSGSMSPMTVESGKTVTLNPCSYQRQKYNFMGWLDQNGNSYTDQATISPAEDLTLTAQWTEYVVISEANFPDAIFRNYVAPNFDRDRDGYLSSAEIAWTVNIDVSWKGIGSLDGLEYFSSLQSLNCTYNQLTELNITSCPNLSVLDCFSNKISSLDLTHCPALLSLVENTQATVYGSDIIEFDLVGDAVQDILFDFDPAGVIPVSEDGTSRLSYDDGVTIQTGAPEHAVNYVNFPDPIFRAYVSENCDTDQNGVLSDEEIAAVTWIDCSGTEEEKNSVASLRGIEHFTSLVMLDCSSNDLERLDLSGNTGLEVLDCSNNRLTNLNISDNAALTTVWCYKNYLEELALTEKPMLKELWCNNNWISSLNLSEVPNLTVLWCHDNKLNSIDVRGLPGLKTLSCAINWLSTLDLSQNAALATLWCSDNRISELDLSQNPELRTLGCYANGITELDISMCPALLSLVRTSSKTVNGGIARYFDESTTDPSYLLCDDSTALSVALIDEENFPDQAFRAYVLSSIDKNNDAVLSNREIEATSYLYCSNRGIASLRGIELFPSLTSLYCENNELTELDLTGCAALTNLYCNNNWLAELNLGGCGALSTLYCPDNDLTSLDLVGCDVLTTLDCSGNILTSLDLRTCTALTGLNCNNNLISALDLSQNKALSSLNCSGNMIIELTLNGCAGLKTLNCNDNLLDSLDLSGCAVLNALNCAGNCLTDLDLGGCAGLRTLRCTGNMLYSLNLEDCAALVTLECGGNRLTELLPGGWARLRTLLCGGNQLAALDLGKAAVLSTLDCRGNNLTSLHVDGCGVLKSLLCYENALASLNLRGCPALMSLMDSAEPVIRNGVVTYGGKYSNSSVLAFDDGVVINSLPDPDFILPASLTVIEPEAFAGGAFVYVVVPEQVTVIGSRAFADCPNLRYVGIQGAATQIAPDAFENVPGLTILDRSGVPSTG